jgi:hypothetical protein
MRAVLVGPKTFERLCREAMPNPEKPTGFIRLVTEEGNPVVSVSVPEDEVWVVNIIHRLKVPDEIGIHGIMKVL